LYRKGVARLDLNVYSCGDANCNTKTSSTFFSDVNNNSLLDVSLLSSSQYLGYDFTFGKASGFSDFNADSFFVNALVNSFEVVSQSPANTAPSVTFNSLEGESLSSSSAEFSFVQDGNLDLDFNVLDSDGDSLFVTVRYGSTPSLDGGTVLYNYLRLSSDYCDGNVWSSSSVNCDLNILTNDLSDGNFYIKIELSDDSNSVVQTKSDLAFAVDNSAISQSLPLGETAEKIIPALSNASLYELFTS